MSLRRNIYRFLFDHPLLYTLLKPLRGWKPILIDYPPDARPRYGYGKPPHAALSALLERQAPSYAAAIQGVAEFKDQLAAIGLNPSLEATDPWWLNDWLAPADALMLYGFVRRHKPTRYVEIGSGMSTAFARRAIKDGFLATRITSIDPAPRAGIDALCDEVVRTKLEDVDPARFETLVAGDMLFIDGSHRCLMNSDVTVFFLDVLPRLAPGVIVHLHDIFLPLDYPPRWSDFYYSEQYVLAAILLNDAGRFDVLFPSAFALQNELCRPIFGSLFDDLDIPVDSRAGGSFWLRRGLA
jgi:predicted O-methyltransferase YrrM